MDDDQVHDALARAEAALAELEELPPPASRTALEGVEAIVRVYAEALQRMAHAAAEHTPELGDVWADDPLVAHLLLLHDVHPHSTRRRVADALGRVLAHRAGVEVAEVEDARVVVRISGADGAGNPTPPAEALEQVVREAAPEVAEVEIDDQRLRETWIPVNALFRKVGEPAGRSGS